MQFLWRFHKSTMAKPGKISRTLCLLFALQLCTILCMAANTKCPPGIQDVMEECTCTETTTSVFVRCNLGGETYTQLPTFGKVNVTVRQITLEHGTIGDIHDGVFKDLLVSGALHTYITSTFLLPVQCSLWVTILDWPFPPLP